MIVEETTMKRFRGLMLCLAVLLASLAAEAQITIKLKNSFINEFREKVTISANFTVDATSKIHPPSQDGDIHIAGRAPEIGLGSVAEVMNAKMEAKTVVKQIQSMAGTDTPIKLTGVWRLWCEHGGQINQVQGQDPGPMASSGATHVFEIHPITDVAGTSVLETIQPISGFQYKDADEAFTAYERTNEQIIPDTDATTLVTEKVGFNYVEFVLEIESDSNVHSVVDGTFALADVLDLQLEKIVHRRRMVFIKGTPADDLVKTLKPGDRLHVIGIPRINLELVHWRLQHADDPRKPLTWNLPYEVVIVGLVEQLDPAGTQLN
jgi:hypothetical protein